MGCKEAVCSTGIAEVDCCWACTEEHLWQAPLCAGRWNFQTLVRTELKDWGKEWLKLLLVSGLKFSLDFPLEVEAESLINFYSLHSKHSWDFPRVFAPLSSIFSDQVILNWEIFLETEYFLFFSPTVLFHTQRKDVINPCNLSHLQQILNLRGRT